MNRQKLELTPQKLKRLMLKYYYWGKNDEPEDKTLWCIEAEIEELEKKHENK